MSVVLTGKMLAFSRLVIDGADWAIIETALGQFAHKQQVPVVVQVDTPLDLQRLIDLLWRYNMAVIGVSQGVLDDQAVALKVAIFPSDGKRIAHLDDKAKPSIKPVQAQASQHDLGQNSTSGAEGRIDMNDNVADPLGVNKSPNTKNDIDNNSSNNDIKNDNTSNNNASNNNANSGDVDGYISLDSDRPPNHQPNPSSVLGISQEAINPEAISPDEILPIPAINSRIHSQLVRSGQSIHHMGGDLVIASSVNNGAEVATDCNLHIYGKGQGRLVAGATGDENARIFCQNFDPTLVSVAGTYCLKEDIDPKFIGQAVMVSFSLEKGLTFVLMNG